VTLYCLGFMFSFDRRSVLLIEKQRPDWQAGLLNGIGGRVEQAEHVDASMVREFREETGITTVEADWLRFAALRQDEVFTVQCYLAMGDIYAAKTMTDERVLQVSLSDMEDHATVPNVRWLVPLARDFIRTAGPLLVNVDYAPKEEEAAP